MASNPSVWTYNVTDPIAVTNPTLLSIAEYLSKIGAEDYTYDYDEILSKLNAATNAGYANTQQEEQNNQNAYLRSIAANQATAADTIRQAQAQAIQQGITKGIANANLLSTLLGTSQSAAEGAQALAEQRVTDYNSYAKQLLDNETSALTTHNQALETLMSNIRQLYNDDIQQKTADLEYNASLQETLANALANKYAADTNYAIANTSGSSGSSSGGSGNSTSSSSSSNASSSTSSTTTKAPSTSYSTGSTSAQQAYKALQQQIANSTANTATTNKTSTTTAAKTATQNLATTLAQATTKASTKKTSNGSGTSTARSTSKIMTR